MKQPSNEYLMVVDLMLQLNNLNISKESQDFIAGLYHHLDPYEQFLEQQTQKQLKWLRDLHSSHIGKLKW